MEIEIKPYDKEEPLRSISMEEANEFMDLTAKLSNKMAVAIGLFIISPVCLLILAGMKQFFENILLRVLLYP